MNAAEQWSLCLDFKYQLEKFLPFKLLVISLIQASQGFGVTGARWGRGVIGARQNGGMARVRHDDDECNEEGEKRESSVWN